jgi:preprotein translocase subunit YajC
MTLLTALVLAAAAPAGGGLQDELVYMAPLIFMFGALYFFMIRPQQRRQKEHMERVNSVKRGDTVVMSNGMIGKVVRVEESEIGVEIAQNVTVKVVKGMLHEIRSRTEPAPANDRKKAST